MTPVEILETVLFLIFIPFTICLTAYQCLAHQLYKIPNGSLIIAPLIGFTVTLSIIIADFHASRSKNHLTLDGKIVIVDGFSYLSLENRPLVPTTEFIKNRVVTDGQKVRVTMENPKYTKYSLYSSSDSIKSIEF